MGRSQASPPRRRGWPSTQRRTWRVS
jgi:hypothetical protein